MATNGPDPREFLERAQRMLGELFGEQRGSADRWAEAGRHREPSPEEQRQNLGFALAARAGEALEDLALNVAAIRQRLERTGGEAPKKRETKAPRPDGDDATAE